MFGAPLPVDENRISVVICKCVNFRDCARRIVVCSEYPELFIKTKAAFEAGEKVDLDNFVVIWRFGTRRCRDVAQVISSRTSNPLFLFESYRRLIKPQDGLKEDERETARYLNDPFEVPKMADDNVYCAIFRHHGKSRHQQDDTGEHFRLSRTFHYQCSETSTSMIRWQ